MTITIDLSLLVAISMIIAGIGVYSVYRAISERKKHGQRLKEIQDRLAEKESGK